MTNQNKLTAGQKWLADKLMNPEFEKEYKKTLAEVKDEQKAIRQLQRAEWMQEAFEGYADSEVETIWESIDGEDFVE